MDGEQILFDDPHRWTTIWDLKNHVQKNTGIPVDKQVHYFASSEAPAERKAQCKEPLMDDKTICGCGLDEFPKVLVTRTTVQNSDFSGSRDDNSRNPLQHNPKSDKKRRKQCELIPQNECICELTTSQMKRLLESSDSNARRPPPDIAHIAHKMFVQDKDSVRKPFNQEHTEEVACHVIFLFVKKNFPDLHLHFDASLVADFILQETPIEELYRIMSLYCQHDTGAERQTHRIGIKELNRKVKEAVDAFQEHDYQFAPALAP
jgi:hypothetical protein